MVLNQIDRHQGRRRVELIPVDQRTQVDMANRFETFAREECSGNSGLAVTSPTYATLSRKIAESPSLIDMARECRLGQPIPNLFFAAVKRVAESHPDSELAQHYRVSGETGQISPGVAESFKSLCLNHASEIVDLVRTQRVQTNEIRRCSYLMPSFNIASQRSDGQPLALIDVGASAGLNLLWDKYQYLYSDGSVFGPADSKVTIDSEIRGQAPDLPGIFAKVAFRRGIDLNSVDLGDEEEFRWIVALVWPEHTDRAELLTNARDIWLENPPNVESGDALELLPTVLESVPDDAALCVFHCHVLNQFPVEARTEFNDILNQESHRRPVFHLPSEGEWMSLNRIDRGETTTIMSARRHAHGRWIEWTKLPHHSS